MRSLLSAAALLTLASSPCFAETITMQISTSESQSIAKFNFDNNTVVAITDGEEFTGTFSLDEKRQELCDTSQIPPQCAKLIDFKRQVGHRFQIIFSEDLTGEAVILEISD